MTNRRKRAEFPWVPANQIIAWAMIYDYFLYVNGNDHEPLHGAFPQRIFVGKASHLVSDADSFGRLDAFINDHNDWIYGYFSYDLKNETEALLSKNPLTIPHPHLEFVVPETIVFFQPDGLIIESFIDPATVYDAILKQKAYSLAYGQSCTVPVCKTSRTRYEENVEKIKTAILEGEFYEMNYCIEFTAHGDSFSPYHAFDSLNSLSPMPFSAFMKLDNCYLLSASPERFLKKTGDRLISQPMKGTIGRSNIPALDETLKQELANSEKEKAENLMIVDLVRNDLARSALPGTVAVDELFGMYTFKRVHQMISTVSATVRPGVPVANLIKHAFPMGSMTGAPKIRVMEEIDLLEDSARGLYSGAVGFFTPEKDFDFNVVIRSIQYDETNKTVSFHVGSAITADSEPEKEYAECLLKAAAILEVLRA